MQIFLLNYIPLPVLCPVESDTTSYLKQALLLGQNTFLQVPEVEMRFPAGHYDAAVSGVKVCTQHGLVGAL